MGYKPRIHFEGAVYHAGNRGVDRRIVFVDDNDCRMFMRILDSVVQQCGARVLAHCLMRNHFHLALKIGAVPLSTLMQRLQTRYAMYFNWKYDRTGHLFERRFWDELCKTNAQLIMMVRYIHENPVRAGLVKQAGDWPWSSYWEWEREGRSGLVASESDLPNLEAESPAGILLRSVPEEDEVPSVEALIAEACEDFGYERAEFLKSRRHGVAKARRELIRRAVQLGARPIDIARALGVSPSVVSKAICENEKSEKSDTKALLRD